MISLTRLSTNYVPETTMHPTAYMFVRNMVSMMPKRRRVLEIGSLDINGSIRSVFDGIPYVGLDIVPGPGVDIVANGATWQPEDGQLFDTVISTETLEHTPEAEAICLNACNLLSPGGVFIVTAAGEGRVPHSAIDGRGLRSHEFYRNVSFDMMTKWLTPFGFWMINTNIPRDIYALAVRCGGPCD
jgi:hypothetical protein